MTVSGECKHTSLRRLCLLVTDKLTDWETWRVLLQDLRDLHDPHIYTQHSLSKAKTIQLCLFLDVTNRAIAAVSYLRVVNEDEYAHVGLVLRKAKLIPHHKPAMPCSELCAAVLAVEIPKLIKEEIDLRIDDIIFYCDSKVVPGYIFN